MLTNMDSKEDLEKNASEFNRELGLLLEKYAITDEKTTNFRLSAYKFAFVGTTSSSCPKGCLKYKSSIKNGKVVVEAICTC